MIVIEDREEYSNVVIMVEGGKCENRENMLTVTTFQKTHAQCFHFHLLSQKTQQTFEWFELRANACRFMATGEYLFLVIMTNSEAWRFDVFLTHHFFILFLRRIFFINSKISLTFRFDERVVALVVLLFCYCGWLWCLSSLDLTLWLCQPEIKLMSGGFSLILPLLFLWRSLRNECYLDCIFIGFVNYWIRVGQRFCCSWNSNSESVINFIHISRPVSLCWSGLKTYLL